MNQQIADAIIDTALREGAQEAEVYMKGNRGFSVEVKGQQIESIESFITAGYGVRVIRDLKVGFSYSTDFKVYREVVSRALASLSHVDAQTANRLPQRIMDSKAVEVDVFDPEIETLKEDKAIELILFMESRALAKSCVKKIRSAAGSFCLSETLISNSRGLSGSYRSSLASAEIMLAAEKDGEGSVGLECQYSRHLADLDFGALGQGAAESASMLLGARKIKGCRAFVLLDRAVVVEFLRMLASSFSSDAVHKGRSLLSNKIGHVIISPKVDIIDSGITDRMVGSSPFDAEGTTTRKTMLVEGGLLKGYLYNSYTAAKEGVESTGNARRGGYSSLPAVGINNLSLRGKEGETACTLEEMFRYMGRGIYVLQTMGMHTANPVSGDFSVGVSGLWIEGGEKAYPFKETLISGNILAFLSSIVLIGDDTRFYGNIGAPSILIGEIDISA